MITINNRGEKIIVDHIEVNIFSIKEIKGVFEVEFLPQALELIKTPRYIGWFSAIDLVRHNLSVTLNALCNDKTDVNHIAQLQQQSLIADANTNQIVFQCFRELGII